MYFARVETSKFVQQTDTVIRGGIPREGLEIYFWTNGWAWLLNLFLSRSVAANLHAPDHAYNKTNSKWIREEKASEPFLLRRCEQPSK
ncbi:hypothetical protein BDZ97DRAFT_1851198 [Flammula alnicola]|nr:hypothetical protein BDZ97DRAFT_1851198 [Flammula alnicola]